MPSGHPKVLVIIGRGRSGSTILDNILGEIDGFFSAGELHNLWKRGLIRGHTCGCGQPIASCALWRSVLEVASTKLTVTPSAGDVVRWQEQMVTPRQTRGLLKETKHGEDGSELRAYAALLDSVYAAISEVTGARVIIDSSKRPAHAALLHLLPHSSPYFVQMVRDPRAVSYSRTRVKSDVDERQMKRGSSFRSAVKWLQRNREAEADRRSHPSEASLVIRYEDFIAEPRLAVESIVNLVGENPECLPISRERQVSLGQNHTAAGNPSRFRRGVVKLREDNEWLVKQKALDRLVTTAVALPLLKRYGYRVRLEQPASHRPLLSDE